MAPSRGGVRHGGEAGMDGAGDGKDGWGRGFWRGLVKKRKGEEEGRLGKGSQKPKGAWRALCVRYQCALLHCTLAVMPGINGQV
jgi:hypothetical protein